MQKKKEKRQFEDSEQAPEMNVTEMLELSDQKINITMINMLRVLMNNSMQEQMGNAN